MFKKGILEDKMFDLLENYIEMQNGFTSLNRMDKSDNKIDILEGN